MKKIFGFGLIFAILLMSPGLSLAAEFRAGDQPTIQANEKVTNDVYLAGGSVTSAGNITGDLVAGGGTIIISGNVTQDVIAGGGNVSIFSTVGDDVRVGGGNVIVEGKVGGDVIAGGGQVTISGPGVGGDVAIGGGTIHIDAPITGKLTVKGGTVYINAPVGGDINIEADKITLGSKAIVSGNITYKSSKELVKEDGAVVNGTVIFEPKVDKMAHGGLALAAIFSALLVWKFFALLISALLFGLIFKGYSKQVVAHATKRPLLEIGRGLVVFAAMIVIPIILFITLVGIPFAIIGVFSFLLALLFTWIVTPIILGSVVYKYFTKKDAEVSWKTILLGVIICTILGIIPFVGWFIQGLIMLLTLGSIALLKWQIVKEWM